MIRDGQVRQRKLKMRPTSWWLEKLRQRARTVEHEKLHLQPAYDASDEERDAAIRFFNAAYRAEESGLQQAALLAERMRERDPELAEALELYGKEEGWHRELLVEFLDFLGGDVRPMGRVTSVFYGLYAKAERCETIVLANLMFETIGSTTYRMTLRHAEHPSVRQMLTILTRDEAFHVPLNVHFMRKVLAQRKGGASLLAHWRLRLVYQTLFVALVASTVASRRRAKAFDRLSARELATAYAEQLAGLFWQENEWGLRPPMWLLRLLDVGGLDAVSESVTAGIERAALSADRSQVSVAAM